MDAHNGSHSTKPTFAEFFAGIGLMRMGLEAKGWNAVYANDIDPQKLEMYRAQFPDADDHFHLGDIHKINVDTIPTVDLATASFPCTDLSLAGGRLGLAGKQSSAFWGFIMVLEKMGERRPSLVLLENVTGFLSSHQGADFRNAMLALNGLGYSVDAFVIDSAHFVPQSRQRLFVVGVRNAQAPAGIRENLSLFGDDLRPQALQQVIYQDSGIRWNTRTLPSLPKRSRRLESIVEDLPADSAHWWSDARAQYLLGQMSERHRLVIDPMIAGKKWSYGTVFRRVRSTGCMAELRTDGIAGCLRTPKGGSGRQILVKAGYGEFHARLLTPRECGRLMGADNYNIQVSLNQALFGFGDAVCVPVVSWIAENYLTPVLLEVRQPIVSTTERSFSARLTCKTSSYLVGREEVKAA